jgi:ABC-type branched-subunit amino acid transport system substrate-binding protein
MARFAPTRLIAGLAFAGVLAACSSAPAPTALTQDGGSTGSTGSTGGTSAPGSTTTGGQPSAAAPATTGAVVAPGATSGTSTAGTGQSSTTGGSTGAAPGTTGGGTSTSGGTSGATASTSGGTTGTSPVLNQGSQLFTPAEDRIGIDKTSIKLCAHAALTYAKAFHTDVSDLNVFWTALNTEKGGIYGRKVSVDYKNDNYTPKDAVVAASSCVDEKIFMLLGGIGFDQIPAVRDYVEGVHQLYLYHSATVEGSAGKKYSFTELPTVERMGQGFAQLANAKYQGKKVGIIERDSTNWAPGVSGFKKSAKGFTIVADRKVAASKGNYTDDITAMKNAKADVVWIWLNALESTELIKQMKAQLYSPRLLVFPFNLTSQTLGNDALTPVMDGVAMYPSYSKGDYSGSFASYADDMKQFEAQYAKYDPNVDLSGNAGDLLFLNWTAQKALYQQFLDCGPDCTRNRFVDVLQGYHKTPISSACPIDFTHGDGHHGATNVTFMETYKAPSGAVNWRETQKCVAP